MLLSQPNEPPRENSAPVTETDAGADDGGASDTGLSDRGPDDRAPRRRCIVSRVSEPVDQLIRFVRAPDGTVVPDLRRRLPGRGVWIRADRRMVADAQRKRLFGRAFKADARAADDLADTVLMLLRKAALDRLGLERKAGRLRLGFTEVDRLLRSGEGVLLVTAKDAADDGARKIAQAAHAGGDTAYLCRAFTIAELSLALGRGNVIHAALQRGSASDAVIASCRRLDRYEGSTGPANGDIAATDTGPASALGPARSAGRTE